MIATAQIPYSFAMLRRLLGSLLVLALLMIGGVGSQALGKTITINYTGTAPASSKITVSASGSNYVLGTPAHPSYNVEFDISGLTAAQARNYVLTGSAPGKPAQPGLNTRTNAAVNAAGTGLDLTTIDAIGIFSTRTVAVDEVDVTPNNPAKKATNSNYAVAALDPRQNNGVGNPANVTQLAIGPGIAGGGPLGSDGAAGGQLLLSLNSVPISTTLTDGETSDQAAADLYNALKSDGFALAPPDPFGVLELDFNNATNFALLGSPSLLSVDFGFSATADNLDLSIDTFAAPEPTSLTLLGVGAAMLSLVRRRRT